MMKRKLQEWLQNVKHVGAPLLSGQNCSPVSTCKKIITYLQFQLSRKVIIITIIIIELF